MNHHLQTHKRHVGSPELRAGSGGRSCGEVEKELLSHEMPRCEALLHYSADSKSTAEINALFALFIPPVCPLVSHLSRKNESNPPAICRRLAAQSDCDFSTCWLTFSHYQKREGGRLTSRNVFVVRCLAAKETPSTCRRRQWEQVWIQE